MALKKFKQNDFEEDRKLNSYLIPNIARALKILEYLSLHTKEAGIAELATILGYPNNRDRKSVV